MSARIYEPITLAEDHVKSENDFVAKQIRTWQSKCSGCNGSKCLQLTPYMRPVAKKGEGGLIVEALQECGFKRRKEYMQSLPKMCKKVSLQDIRVDASNQRAMKALKFLLNTENPPRNSLYLFGPANTGKTLMGTAFMQEQIGKGVKAFYITVREYFENLKMSFTQRIVFDSSKYNQAPCLILDNFGMNRLTDWEAKQLMAVMARRCRDNLQTIILSRLCIEDLQGSLEAVSYRGDICREDYGMEIVNSIMQMAYIVEIPPHEAEKSA